MALLVLTIRDSEVPIAFNTAHIISVQPSINSRGGTVIAIGNGDEEFYIVKEEFHHVVRMYQQTEGG